MVESREDELSGINHTTLSFGSNALLLLDVNTEL